MSNIQDVMTSYKKGQRRASIKIFMLKMIHKTKSILGGISKKILGNHHPLIKRVRKVNYHISKRIGRYLITNTNYQEGYKSINSTRINNEIGVNISGYITAESGVGEAVRGNIRAFQSAKIPYVLSNVESSTRQEDRTHTAFIQDNPYNINYIHINAEQVPIFYLQKGEKYFRGKYNIGYWIWELSKFPEEWIPHFRLFNEIWTASTFSAESISKVSPIPVVIIPHSIYIERLDKVNRSHFGIDAKSYVFLFMFDFQSYFERKNPLAVIKAFKIAFRADEDVHLVLKCSSNDWNPAAFQEIKEVTAGLRVKLIDSFLSKDQVNSLINMSDCYISLHRSEGFGLPLAEAMYLGKPVIATAYSGNMDFMNVNNSFLINYKIVEIGKKDIGPYKAGSVWAEPDVYHAAEIMRYVYKNRDIGAKVGQIASEDIRSQFNPVVVGRRITDRMEIIKKVG